MSAVYHSEDFQPLYSSHFNAIVAWVKANPGKTIDDCATAVGVPYEIVYAVCRASQMVILPSASSELQFGPSLQGNPNA